MVAMTPSHAPEGAAKQVTVSTAGDESLRSAVAQAQLWLTAIYRLDLDLRAEQFVIDPQTAMMLLPPDSPRSGVLVLEEPTEVSLGLYVDAEDADDPWTVLEETSHLLYLAWLADRDWSVSRLVLELQGEVDRYAVTRLRGQNGLEHFEDVKWAGWLTPATRDFYVTAHRCALRYCQGLERRHPERCDTPALLSELRAFYRSTPSQKLHAA
jgi:hypothetical protein